ncbi:MAG: hypothetical protein K8T89_19210 [Planctomycetes bacterium]|nr:hypothetical protein [Planctomycetota bacterium]
MNRTRFRLLIAPLLALGTLCCMSDLAAQPDSTVPKDKTDAAEKNPLIIEAKKLFFESKFDEAFAKLKKATDGDKELPPARLMLARLLRQTKEGQQAARQVLEIAGAENPNHPEIYLTMGSIALEEGRFTEAYLCCRVALTYASDEDATWTPNQRKIYQKEARAGLAAAFEARKDWANTQVNLKKWLEFEPKNAQIRQRLARALFQIKPLKEEEVYAELLTASKDDSNLEPAEVSMGLLHGASGEKDGPKKAEEWFAKALEKYKDKKPAKDKDGKDIDENVKFNKQKARVHQSYGGWLLDTGKLESAKEQITIAKEMDANSRETLGLIGLQARYENNLPLAETCFSEILRLFPSDFFASNQMALVLIEMSDEKQQKRGLEYAEDNVRKYNKSPEALATLGWCYFKLGRLKDAEQALGAAVSGGQASPDTAYYLASLQKDLSKFKEAYENIEKAVTSQGVFVNRKKGDALFTFLKTKHTPEPKKADPKDEKKEEKK